jgi:hypothetical protein
MIIWGGGGPGIPTTNIGGRYKPSTDNWVATCDANAPVARLNHSALWTGSDMIVWGGQDANSNRLGTGSRYSIPANPIDAASFFVRRHYLDFLSREPDYFGYLRRNPNDAPDSDYTGYDFWLTKLNQFNGNYINAEMVKAFLSSIEYRQRFGP